MKTDRDLVEPSETVPSSVRHLMTDLSIGKNEGRDIFDADDERRRIAASWLCSILGDCRRMLQHIHLLESLTGGRFRIPLPKRLRTEGSLDHRDERFGDWRGATSENRHGLIERKSFPVDQLADLLLDPYALWSLMEDVQEAMADAWVFDLSADWTEEALQRNSPEPSDQAEPSSWPQRIRLTA